MDTTTVKMHIFLDICYELECTCATLYNFFARHFNADRDISDMWLKTALEEDNHARHVLLAKKLGPSISWINIEPWRNALQLLEETRQLTSSAQASPPTLINAINLALKCESKLECFHMQNAIRVNENAGNSMFKALLQADQEHVVMLQSALKGLQVPAEEELVLVEIEDL